MKHRILLVLFAALLLVLVFGACAERHVYGDWIDETLATCTENGFRGHYHCEHCGKNFTVEKIEISDEELVIPATGHAWDNGAVTTPATCTEDGTKTYTCTNPNCGKTKTETIPAGHTFGEWIPGTEATASTPGEKGHYHCSVCEKDFGEDKQTELTDIVIPPLNHTYGPKNGEIPATCTEDGKRAYYVCTCCGKFFDETFTEVAEADLTIPSPGHNPEWIVDKTATCTEVGSKHQVCTVCGETLQTQEIPMEDHELIGWVEKQEANCGYCGKAAHDECKKCHQYFDQNGNKLDTIDIAEEPATGAHVYGEWIPEKPATNDEVGHVGHYHCDVCGKNFDKDHNEIDNIVTTVWSPLV